MPEKIEAALSPEEWAALRASNNAEPTTYVSYHGDRPEKFIAEANFRLRDDDPRKITREKIRLLLQAADIVERESTTPSEDPLALGLEDFADALESYLPPA